MEKRAKQPGSGRKKGTPNRLTKAFKDLLADVLAEEKTLTKLRALRDSGSAIDRSTFWRLAGKFVPVKVESNGLLTLKVVDYSDQAEREGDGNGEA